ncbi:CbtA family protein [Polaromonas sp. YR568]|uniref:CbtA family protein n=1 Tax=Polaromonas sp. YR568 TaxID=1855301 RepID=UPI00398BC2EB
MIFQRLIWAALATAVVVGSVQTGVQRWQAAPLILAAEVYEEQKAEAPAPAAPVAAPAAHAHAEGTAPHEHGTAKEWEPANGAERTGWTWVANMLHAFSMALLLFAVMGVWLYRRGSAVASLRLAGLVAAAGWLSFHFWPSLGLHAEVPGMEAAPLQARQLWWVLAVASAAGACAVAGFARASWRWLVVAALLALPFVVGAPKLQGDALAGFGPEAHAALEQLGTQFIWATTWVSLSFWVSLGLVGGLAFQRWVRPALLAVLQRGAAPAVGAVQAPQ